MNSDSLNMVSRLGEGHMPRTFFLSEPQLKTTVLYCEESLVSSNLNSKQLRFHGVRPNDYRLPGFIHFYNLGQFYDEF